MSKRGCGCPDKLTSIISSSKTFSNTAVPAIKLDDMVLIKQNKWNSSKVNFAVI